MHFEKNIKFTPIHQLFFFLFFQEHGIIICSNDMPTSPNAIFLHIFLLVCPQQQCSKIRYKCILIPKKCPRKPQFQYTMHYILNLFWQVEQPQIQGTRERVHLVIHQEVLQEALARPSTYSSHVFTNPEFSICNCLFDTIGILYSIEIKPFGLEFQNSRCLFTEFASLIHSH